AGVKKGSLDSEIQQVVNSGKLPAYLIEALDVVREIGNIAAHPTEDTETGAIVDVEPGEAESLLDVIEGLFDFYFVLPKKMAQRREATNEKLRAAGRRELPKRTTRE